MDNNAPILRRYVAEAVAATLPQPGRGFHARFGFPGGVVDFVRNGEAPALYTTARDAENDARLVLFEALNSRQRFGSKRELSSKMTGDEFAAELAETGIPLSDFAMMWGTKQETALAWIQGEKEVPFPLRWVLQLLRDPVAVERVQKIVESNVTYKPEWLERQRQRAENKDSE